MCVSSSWLSSFVRFARCLKSMNMGNNLVPVLFVPGGICHFILSWNLEWVTQHPYERNFRYHFEEALHLKTLALLHFRGIYCASPDPVNQQDVCLSYFSHKSKSCHCVAPCHIKYLTWLHLESVFRTQMFFIFGVGNEVMTWTSLTPHCKHLI